MKALLAKHLLHQFGRGVLVSFCSWELAPAPNQTSYPGASVKKIRLGDTCCNGIKELDVKAGIATPKMKFRLYNP